MRRMMRDYTETFYFLLCWLEFQEPISGLVQSSNIFAIPNEGNVDYSITLQSIMYDPQDTGTESCPSFTDDVLLDLGETRESFEAESSTTSEVVFELNSSDIP